MAAKNRQTLIDRTRTGKPWVSGDLTDLIDTIFALDVATNRKIGNIETSIKSVSTTINQPAIDPFAELQGTGFLVKSSEGKWGFDVSSYLTKDVADSWYAQKSHTHPYARRRHAEQHEVGGDDIVTFGLLTGISLTDPLPGQQLWFNGTHWVNQSGLRHRFPINDDGSYDFNLAYNPATKILTMTPVGSSFYVHIKGVKYTFVGTQTLPPHTTAEKTFVFVNSSGQLEMGTSGFNLLAHAPVAIIYWDAVAGTGFCVPERHTDRMSPRTHERLHEVQGAEAGRRSGFAISGYTYNLDTVAGVTFGVSGGKVWDEDIPHLIPSFTDGSTYTIFRRTGAAGSWTWETASTLPYKTGTTYATTNVFSGGAWTQQELAGGGTGEFMNMFVVGLPNINIQQIVLVQGQGVFTSQALAEAQTWDTLDIGTLPSFEMPALYQIVLKSQVALGSATKKTVIVAIRKVATSGGGSGVGGSTVHNSLSGRSDADTHPFSSLTGVLGSTQFPTLTGDVANTALATTVNGLKGYVLPTLGAAANLRWSGSAWTMDTNSYVLTSSLANYVTTTVFNAGISGRLPASGGSTNKVAKWTSATTLGYGIATDNGSLFSVAGTIGGSDGIYSSSGPTIWAGDGQYGISSFSGTTFLWAASEFSFNKRIDVSGNGSFTGSVDAGNARIQSSAIGTGGWFGYPGKNTAGAYIGAYAFSDGSIRIASQAGQPVSIGSGANYGALVAGDDGVRVGNLTSGGMVKAASGTGLLGIAGRSDLPGGPYLPLSAGSGERVTGGLYLDNDFFLDGRAFLGNGDFIVRTGEVIFKIGDGFGWASPSIHFPSVATQYSFRVEGGSRFDGTADFTNTSAGIRTTDIKVGTSLQRTPHLFTTSDVLPELGVNEFCLLVCDDDAPSIHRWLTNGTQPVRIRSGGTTTTTTEGGNNVSDSGGAIDVSRMTCILIGPTDSGSNVCSFIPF